MQSSQQTSRQFFNLLSSGQGSANAPNLQSQVDEARLAASNQSSHAQSLSAPDSVKSAQQNLVLALQMRVDAIGNIAQQIQPALQTQTSSDSDNAIAAKMARLYASDVVYKGYMLPTIVGALHSAGIAVGGANGEPLFAGQFLPDVQWLTPAFVASALHLQVPPPTKVAPGTHGHALNSRERRSGTTLQTGSTNTIPASPPPTFTLNFSNTGQNTETNVDCKVTVSGSSVSGQTVVPKTSPGQSTAARSRSPPRPSPGSANRQGDGQPGAGREEHRQQHADVPGHVPVDAAGATGLGAGPEAPRVRAAGLGVLMLPAREQPQQHRRGNRNRSGRRGGRGAVLCAILALKLRSLRADQRAVLGERRRGPGGARRLSPTRVRGAVRLRAGRGRELGQRLQEAERRLDRAVSYCSLVRYDAYGEMSGRQSTSIALLDAHRSGLVLSSIHHRDQARLYAKQVRDGQA